MRADPISNVCVIGGGPAGLAAAIAVSQAGFRATVIDHAVPPIDKACGEGLMPDSLAVLQRLGVTIPSDAGFRFRGIRFADSQSSVAADFPEGMGIGLRRTLLHDLLIKRAGELGVVCHWGAKRVQFGNARVSVDGQSIPADLIVAADGQNSSARRAGGLHSVMRERFRYAFRRHYRIAPWTPYMEIYWGPRCQVYVTPIASDEVCVVSMAATPQCRLDEALAHLPRLRERLANAQSTSRDMGALSVTRSFRRVVTKEFALVGDASGSVDAITGEGLCLSFKQSLSLAAALRSGRVASYQRRHRWLSRRPEMMGRLMLSLDRNPAFQRRAMASLALHPGIFASLLAVHVGARSIPNIFSRQLLNFCRTLLEA